MKYFIEQQILEAVKKLLAGRVNEIIGNWQENIPVIEFGNYQGSEVVTPLITLAGCEKTEKERIILLETYSVTIVFTIPETEESEMYCYAYAAAFKEALGEDVTLGGVVNKAEVTELKYRNVNEWELTVTLRVIVEQMRREKG